jgi:Ca-activated chloride channel homolog
MDNTFFQFHSPHFLLLFLGIPLYIWLYWRGLKKHKTTVLFPALKTVKKVQKSWKTKLRHIPFVLRILAISFIIIALARPQSGENLEEVNTEGIDIMLVLDLSGSMDLMDMLTRDEMAKLGRMNASQLYRSGEYKKYTRLGYSKDVISQFIQKRKSDRIGLTVFASRAYTQCPLTLDYGILLDLLHNVDETSLDNRGTAIGDALMIGARRLIDSKAKSRVMVLLTDGENTAGQVHPLKAADVAKATGIKVYTIGAGRSNGQFLHFAQNPFSGEILWQESPIPKEGSIDENTLITIAKKTGGEYFRAKDKQDLEKIYATIDELETSEIKSYSYTKYKEMFFVYLLLGAGLFFLELLLSYTRFLKIP